ncbi:MAG: hypothetical protein SGILL_001649 [Bacillariaceae sp.]
MEKSTSTATTAAATRENSQDPMAHVEQNNVKDPTTTSTITFVDYRRPPSAKIQPPSKYKLWLLVFVLVYLAVWVSEGANVSEALRLQGWLSPEGAQFLELAIVVLVLTYGALDCVVAAGTITFRDKRYGLGPWLQCGNRIQWIHKTQFSDYFVLEVLKCVIRILEDGFDMFNAAQAAVPNRRPRKHHYMRQALRKESTMSSETENGSDSEDQDDTSPPYTCSSSDCQTVVKIEHRINPNKMIEYHAWQKRIERAASRALGLISINRMEIVPEKVDLSECPDVELGASGQQDTAVVTDSVDRDEQRPIYRTSTTDMSTMKNANLHTVYITFDNIDSLNDWMISPRRKALMKQLDPLLAVPDQELIQAERAASARDAFTNLIIQQGQSSPAMPPKKWKVWWLTTLALVITIRWVNSFLAYYIEFWGLDKAHPRLRALVTVFVMTFLNSYIMTPFLLFLFNPWILRRSNEVDERPIWKTLDDGIKSLWLKFLLSFAYYGGCVIAWIVHTQ